MSRSRFYTSASDWNYSHLSDAELRDVMDSVHCALAFRAVTPSGRVGPGYMELAAKRQAASQEHTRRRSERYGKLST